MSAAAGLMAQPSSEADEELQRRIMVAKMLGLEAAHPARDCMVTRVDRRVYLGLKEAGYVRLRVVEARALAQALEELAQLIESDPG